MKITKKNKTYTFEMSEFEAKILFLVAANIGGIGRAREVFSDNKESILNLLKDYPEFDAVRESWVVPGVQREGTIRLNGDGPIEFAKNTPIRDKSGKFLTTKKNIRFNYPIVCVRNCSPPYEKYDLERRKILNFKKENGYLTGIDSKDNKFKKFDLEKVSNIRYF